MDFIDRLREKPAGTKKKIAYTTSAAVTLIIFGVWASVLHFGNEQKSADATASVTNSSDTDVNPFSAFWSVISKGWGGLSNNINQIKTGVGEAKDLVNAIGSTTSAGTPVDSAGTASAVSTTSPRSSAFQYDLTQPTVPPEPQSVSDPAAQNDVFILSGSSSDSSDSGNITQ